MTGGTTPHTDEQASDSVPALKPPSVLIPTLATIFAGSIGALLSLETIERIGEVFVLPPDLAGLGFGQVPPPDVQAKLASAVFSNSIRNAAVWMGAVGAILGTCFCLAVFVCGGQRPSKVRMLLSTLVTSTLFVAASGVVGVWLDANSRRNMAPEETSPSEPAVLLMHSIVWAIAGLGIGTGIALGSRQTLRAGMERAVIVGLLGMVGGGLFPVAAGILFPAVDSTLPIPGVDPISGRILWLMLPAVLMGVAIGRNQGHPAPSNAAP